MGKIFEPQVYLIGYTGICWSELERYLLDSGNHDFMMSMSYAHDGGLSDGEMLCSFYAKLCYASLTLGQNDNVTKIRDIPDNLISCFAQGHLSVFEHASINFVIRNCSRVLTHELIRHRVGTAFSQTSGRYVRGDDVNLVVDPILEPVLDDIMEMQDFIESSYRKMVQKSGLKDMTDFNTKKKITSALRRLLPNGQANEIGLTVNLRALRHMVQLRTSRHAEWEIRHVFDQVYRLVKLKFPLVFHGAKEEMVDGIIEVSGMKMQPYEVMP